MYKSFQEAIAAQKGMVRDMADRSRKSSKKGLPKKGGLPAVQSERVEDYIPVADARTESIIASRLRRR